MADALAGPRARVPSLDAIHDRHCRHLNAPTPTSIYLAEHGHPLASEYDEVRAVFDSLTWHAGLNSRFFAFRDTANCVELSPPKLAVTWHPSGFAGFDTVSPLSGARWTSYLAAAAAAAYPPETKPSAFFGWWTVRAADQTLLRPLAGLLALGGITWRGMDGSMDLRCYTLRRWSVIRSAIEDVFGSWRLPAYTPPAPPPSEGIALRMREEFVGPSEAQDLLLL